MPPEIADEARSIGRLPRRQFLRQATCGALIGLTSSALGQEPAAPAPTRVRIWCEGTAPKSVYPEDIDGALGRDFRGRKGVVATLGRLDDPHAGLSDAILDATDTLIWWGRLRHDDVPEARARAVVERVRAGKLGLVALHESCASKPFRALMGPKWKCVPKTWCDDGRPEHVTIKSADHPIARGLEGFTIPKTAMFAEPFDVPDPETVVLVSSWDGGETFRSGLTWGVDKGRVAYFRPGHDGFPILFHPGVRQVIANAALWVAPKRPIG